MILLLIQNFNSGGGYNSGRREAAQKPWWILAKKNYIYPYSCTAVRLYGSKAVRLYSCTAVQLYSCTALGIDIGFLGQNSSRFLGRLPAARIQGGFWAASRRPEL